MSFGARVELDSYSAGYPTSKKDKKYITTNFIDLDRLSTEIKVSPEDILLLESRKLFPKPTYLFGDGTRWYPPSYIALFKRARKINKTFASAFQDEIRAALTKLRKERDLDFSIVLAGEGFGTNEDLDMVVKKIWDDFQSGEYGACLKNPACGTIIKKSLTMHSITSLISSPFPADPEWRRLLRNSVEILDKLEAPFTDFDRVRFGTISRDVLIHDVRNKYPEVFISQIKF
jgi:hypothetical protein